jgi:hypothetical protein
LGGFMDLHRPQQAQVGAFSAQTDSGSTRSAAAVQNGAPHPEQRQPAKLVTDQKDRHTTE